MKRSVLALFALSAAPAFAQEAPITRYDEAALREAAGALGYKVSDVMVDAQGEPSMTMDIPDTDIAFQVEGLNCEGEGKDQACTGLQFAAILGTAGKNDRDKLIADINRTFRPGKLFVIPQGMAFERYMILDGGISKENLEVNLETFGEMLKALWGKING